MPSAMAKMIWTLAASLVLSNIVNAQTARDYFNELKTAKALNRYADEYVCFADDNVPSFSVIARVSDVIEHMKNAGDDAGVKVMMQSKNGLFVQGYYKGVKSGEGQVFEPSGTEGSDYVLEFRKPFHGKATYSVNWVTGRYRYEIYNLTHSSYVASNERSGKCELIHPSSESRQ